MFTLLVVSFVISGSMARAPYQFSDGYLDILGEEPVEDFTCDNLPYGYYADMANDCKVFHICLPIPDHNGDIRETHQYSFFCGNQTVFSQESLTCVHERDAFPCSESENFYSVSNGEFGRVSDDRVQSRQAVEDDESRDRNEQPLAKNLIVEEILDISEDDELVVESSLGEETTGVKLDTAGAYRESEIQEVNSVGHRDSPPQQETAAQQNVGVRLDIAVQRDSGLERDTEVHHVTVVQQVTGVQRGDAEDLQQVPVLHKVQEAEEHRNFGLQQVPVLHKVQEPEEHNNFRLQQVPVLHKVQEPEEHRNFRLQQVPVLHKVQENEELHNFGLQQISGVPKVSGVQRNTEVHKVTGVQRNTEVHKVSGVQRNTEVHKVSGVQRNTEVHKITGVQKDFGLPQVSGLPLDTRVIQEAEVHQDIGIPLKIAVKLHPEIVPKSGLGQTTGTEAPEEYVTATTLSVTDSSFDDTTLTTVTDYY